MLNSEQHMAHTTTRLVVHKADGIHTGTGFFVGYRLPTGGLRIFCVTNRHVLSDATLCQMVVTMSDGEGRPKYGMKVLFDVTDIAQATIFHPNPEIDLAAFPAEAAFNTMKADGKAPFQILLDRGQIPPAPFFDSLGVAEDVAMIGYPNGLFDEVNNMPILRRGITATSPALPFNGRPEFVIDCACFPGSSGSPVFLHQPFGHRDKNGGILINGGRTAFIGVLYAGPTISVQGQIVPRPIPTSMSFAVTSSTMMHLGYCIRAELVTFLDAEVPDWVSSIDHPDAQRSKNAASAPPAGP
jgi:hypothetical protein